MNLNEKYIQRFSLLFKCSTIPFLSQNITGQVRGCGRTEEVFGGQGGIVVELVNQTKTQRFLIFFKLIQKKILSQNITDQVRGYGRTEEVFGGHREG